RIRPNRPEYRGRKREVGSWGGQRGDASRQRNAEARAEQKKRGTRSERGATGRRLRRLGATALGRLSGGRTSREMGSWGGREANGKERAGRGSRRRGAERKR